MRICIRRYLRLTDAIRTMALGCLLSLPLLVGLARPSFAQDSVVNGSADNDMVVHDSLVHDTTGWDLMYEDVGIVVDEGVCYLTAPLRFETSDWVYTALLFGGTLATMTQDAELRQIKFRNNKVSPTWQTVLDAGTRYGNIFTASVGAGALYLTGLILDVYYESGGLPHGKLRGIARMLGEGLFFSGSVAAVMRSLLGRKRPYYYPVGKEDVWAFDLLNMKTSKNAFPSGHMVVTMALSTSLAEYFDTWEARAIFYPLAALGLYARVMADGHWTSDIVFGVGLGVATGLYVANRQHLRERRAQYSSRSSDEAMIVLYPSPNGMGLLIRF